MAPPLRRKRAAHTTADAPHVQSHRSAKPLTAQTRGRTRNVRRDETSKPENRSCELSSDSARDNHFQVESKPLKSLCFKERFGRALLSSPPGPPLDRARRAVGRPWLSLPLARYGDRDASLAVSKITFKVLRRLNPARSGIGANTRGDENHFQSLEANLTTTVSPRWSVRRTTTAPGRIPTRPRTQLPSRNVTSSRSATAARCAASAEDPFQGDCSGGVAPITSRARRRPISQHANR
jgi:hypothetical protein